MLELLEARPWRLEAFGAAPRRSADRYTAEYQRQMLRAQLDGAWTPPPKLVVAAFGAASSEDISMK